VAWSASDEGYLSAYQWSRALAGGAKLPVEASSTPLAPGEVAHAQIGPVSVAAFVGEQWDYPYPPGLFVFGGPLTFAVSGSVAIARDTAWQAQARRAGAPRWQPQGVVQLVVTDRRLLAVGNGKVGSLAYAQAGAVELVSGLGGGPAVQLEAAGLPPLQLETPSAPVLWVFVHYMVDGRAPAVPLPDGLLERAQRSNRLA
jgi:hypothetical protein